MICEIFNHPKVDLPKALSAAQLVALQHSFSAVPVVVRSCANIPTRAFQAHEQWLRPLLMLEPNAEKNKINRKRKLYFAARPHKYSLHFSVNDKLVCLPRYLALHLSQHRLRRDLSDAGDALSPKQRTKQPALRLYAYQQKVVAALLRRFRRPGPQGAITQMGCGLGKTLQTIEFLRQFGVRAAIVTHQDNIFTQWMHQLRYGLPGCTVGRVQQDIFDVEGHGVVLCMIHTLSKRSFPPDAFKGFGLVVFDEVHHVCAKMFAKSVRQFPARCRLGLTATPDRKDGLGYVLSWLVGPRICNVKRRTQMVRVQLVREHTEYGPPILNRKTQQPCYTSMLRRLCNNRARTKRLASIVAREVLHEGRTVLVASGWAKRKHLGAIHDALVPLLCPKLPRARAILTPMFLHLALPESVHNFVLALLYPTIGYFVGERTKKKKAAREREVCLRRVVLTTFKMGEEAMDIPTINTIVLAMPKKGMEQMVGRITRGANLETKKLYPKVIDVIDCTVRVCTNMFAHRRREYKKLGYQIIGEPAAPTTERFEFFQKKINQPRSICHV